MFKPLIHRNLLVRAHLALGITLLLSKRLQIPLFLICLTALTRTASRIICSDMILLGLMFLSRACISENSI